MQIFAEKLRAQTGVSILELVIYIGIASMVTVVVASMMHNSTLQYQNNQTRLELKQDIRAAINMITRDLRMAGCDPDPLDDNDFGLLVAQSDSIRMTSDFLPLVATFKTISGVTAAKQKNNRAGDNKSNSPGEDVSYFLNGDTLVRRAMYADGIFHTETVLEKVTTLQFNYYSAPGTTATLVSSSTIEGANYVQVIIEAESTVADRNTGLPMSMRVSSLIFMRNMLFDQT